MSHNTNNNINYQYNINDKPNPDDVVLYLYTTYDTNSFDPIGDVIYYALLFVLYNYLYGTCTLKCIVRTRRIIC